MKNKDYLYRFALVLTSIFWGFAFAFQSMGLSSLGPYYFNGIRYFIAGICMIPVLFIYNKINPRDKDKKFFSKDQAVAGVLCGLFIGGGSILQQLGLVYTSTGKSSFITALYIILVPLTGIFMKKKVNKTVWIAVIIAVIGMYFLCIKKGSPLNKGDILTLISTLFFTFQIITVDKFIDKTHPIILSMYQFIIASIISLVIAFFNETISLSNIADAIIPLLYLSLISGAAGFTLQIIGQIKTPPTIASLLMSGESVFGAIGGYIILEQVLSVREIIGCSFVFCAIILAQIPKKFK